MKGNNRDNMKKHNDRKYIRIIAATAAAVAIVPTSVFAYNKISSGPSSSISKTAKYQNTIEIQNPTSKAQNESEVSETADSSVSTQTMKIEFGWLPQDLVLQDDNTAFGGKYKNTAMGGMTPMFFKVSKGKNIKYNMKNSNDFEEYETSSQQITINYRTTYDAATASPNNFGREVWVCFKNAPYAANLFFTDDISNDDVKKIAENMTLTPTDRELYQDYQSQEENTDEQIAVPVENKVDMSDIKLYKTGETYVESGANKEAIPESTTVKEETTTISEEATETSITTIETSSAPEESSSAKSDKTELTAILDDIEQNVKPGTAGCSLSSVPYAVKLLDWSADTELTADEIKTEINNWLADKNSDEQVEFRPKLDLINGNCEQLLGDNAKDLLECARCDTANCTWPDSSKGIIKCVMETAGIDSNIVNIP